MPNVLPTQIRRVAAQAVVTLTLLFPSAGVFGATTPTDLRPMLDKLREQYRAPALAAAVVRDGKLVAAGVTGVRDLDTNEPATAQDRSLICSCGKAATRLLIGRLVDQGRLRWDSTLADLLPDVQMRDEYRSVTVGDIIAHRSGLQPYTMITPAGTPILFMQTGSPREQRAAFVAHLLMEPPAAPPKTQFVYSNAGYGLLGYIAERLADKPFEQLMRDEVFRPLGLSSAIVGIPTTGDVHGWVGHMRTPQRFRPVKPPRPGLPAIAPAGLISLSIEDFANLGTALVNVEAGKATDFLGDAAIEQLPELRSGAKGVEGVAFHGGDGHYSAAFALWPSHGLAIVVQSNGGDGDALCDDAIDAVREAVAPDVSPREGATASGEKPKRYGFRINLQGGDDDWVVVDVEPDSPAARAGLKPGDRITAINGTPLEDIPENDRLDRLHHSPLKLRINRDGESLDLEMQLSP